MPIDLTKLPQPIEEPSLTDTISKGLENFDEPLVNRMPAVKKSLEKLSQPHPSDVDAQGNQSWGQAARAFTQGALEGATKPTTIANAISGMGMLGASRTALEVPSLVSAGKTLGVFGKAPGIVTNALKAVPAAPPILGRVAGAVNAITGVQQATNPNATVGQEVLGGANALLGGSEMVYPSGMIPRVGPTQAAAAKPIFNTPEEFLHAAESEKGIGPQEWAFVKAKQAEDVAQQKVTNQNGPWNDAVQKYVNNVEPRALQHQAQFSLTQDPTHELTALNIRKQALDAGVASPTTSNRIIMTMKNGQREADKSLADANKVHSQNQAAADDVLKTGEKQQMQGGREEARLTDQKLKAEADARAAEDIEFQKTQQELIPQTPQISTSTTVKNGPTTERMSTRYAPPAPPEAEGGSGGGPSTPPTGPVGGIQPPLERTIHGSRDKALFAQGKTGGMGVIKNPEGPGWLVVYKNAPEAPVAPPAVPDAPPPAAATAATPQPAVDDFSDITAAAEAPIPTAPPVAAATPAARTLPDVSDDEIAALDAKLGGPDAPPTAIANGLAPAEPPAAARIPKLKAGKTKKPLDPKTQAMADNFRATAQKMKNDLNPPPAAEPGPTPVPVSPTPKGPKKGSPVMDIEPGKKDVATGVVRTEEVDDKKSSVGKTAQSTAVPIGPTPNLTKALPSEDINDLKMATGVTGTKQIKVPTTTFQTPEAAGFAAKGAGLPEHAFDQFKGSGFRVAPTKLHFEVTPDAPSKGFSQPEGVVMNAAKGNWERTEFKPKGDTPPEAAPVEAPPPTTPAATPTKTVEPKTQSSGLRVAGKGTPLDVSGTKKAGDVQKRVLSMLEEELKKADPHGIEYRAGGGGTGSVIRNGEVLATHDKAGDWVKRTSTALNGPTTEEPGQLTLSKLEQKTPVARQKEAILKTAQALGKGRIQIDLPNGGSMSIERNPEAIQAVIKRIKSTGAGAWSDLAETRPKAKAPKAPNMGLEGTPQPPKSTEPELGTAAWHAQQPKLEGPSAVNISGVNSSTPPGREGQEGFTNLGYLGRGALAVVGGGISAKEDPVGHVTGGHHPYLSAALAAGGIMAAPALERELAASPFKLPDKIGSFGANLNALHNTGLLSPLSVAKKGLADVGGLTSAAVENPERAGALIHNLMSPTALRHAYEAGKAGIAAGPSEDLTGTEQFLNKTPLSWAGKSMGALTGATKDILGQSGFNPLEQGYYTMTSKPITKVGGTLYDFINSNNATKNISPFARIGINRIERGIERSPLGLVNLAKKGLSEEQRHDVIQRAIAGSVVAGGVGAVTPEDFVKRHPIAAGLGSAMAGPYGLPIALAMAAKTRKQSGGFTEATKTLERDVPGAEALKYLESPKDFMSTYLSSYTNAAKPVADFFQPEDKVIKTSPHYNMLQNATYGALSNIPGVRGHLPHHTVSVKPLTQQELDILNEFLNQGTQ